MGLGEVQLHGSLSGGCSLMVVGAGIVMTGAPGALLGISLSSQSRLCAVSTWPSLGFLAAWWSWGNQMASMVAQGTRAILPAAKREENYLWWPSFRIHTGCPPPYSIGKYSQKNLSRAKVKRARHHLLMGYGKILEKCVRQDLLQLSLENMNTTCCSCLFLLVFFIIFLLTVSFDPLD